MDQPTNLTDAFCYDELAREWLKGENNKAAFEEIVKGIWGLLCRVANNVLHDEEEAKDAVSETLVWIFQNPSKWRRKRFRAFCCGCVRNNCRNHRKAEIRRGKREVHEGGPDDGGAGLDIETIPDPRPTAAENLALSQFVESVLSELDEEERQVLMLRDMEEWEYPEIARMLGRTRFGTKSLYFRARDKAREIADALEKPRLKTV
jgi:RNA polymerase sigma-70 factor (ECF subfamily)